MTKEELFQFHQEVSRDALSIMERKNADYSTEQDIFSNFRAYGDLGILVRLSDKLARLQVLRDKTHTVLNEPERDSILDAINYLVLYHAFRETQKASPSKRSNNSIRTLDAGELAKTQLPTERVVSKEVSPLRITAEHRAYLRSRPWPSGPLYAGASQERNS